MNYLETLDYLYAHLPMFTRVGDSAITKDLANTKELCRKLKNPEQKFMSVHVAGTNGKGSTSHMLAAILQTAGYKTGLYTSPHLKDFRERIRINGKMMPQSEVIRFVKQQKKTIEEITPSFFEVTVAMAFDYFARNKVDIAVIEVGLGGRLDSTNVINPVLSIITNIGYDHMNILGNTLPEIAFEKAGIIKPGTPVVIGEFQAEVAGVFISKAKECKSELYFATEEWEVEELEDGRRKMEVRKSESPKVGKSESTQVGSHTSYLRPLTSDLRVRIHSLIHSSTHSLILQLDLTGKYQLKNLLTVLSSVEQLRKLGLEITDKHIQTALKQVQRLTGLKGRWQTLSNHPLIICDTGHNQDGIREVLKNIKAIPYEKLHIVIGMLKDKETNKIFALLPKDAAYYFCSPDLQRAKPAEELLNEANTFGLQGKIYSSVKDALQSARSNAKVKDLVFVGGSTFVVAEVL
jgi:dihydrofolate synthase/folylpolyglutamate synthase